MSESSHAGPHQSQAHRVIFIDLARALAVFFMLYGHTVAALLAPAYQTGTWFAIWQFQRGLTSSLFMLLGGFAFSIATGRHWGSHVAWSPSLIKRLRRFGLFVVLGYALHMPVNQIDTLSLVTPEQWRSFLAVDVLQLVGVTFILVQLLVLVARSRRVFMWLSLAVCVAIVWATPSFWGTDWSLRLPAWMGPYLSPAMGSLFPLFPWSGYVFLGAGLGQLYSRWGAAHLGTFARWVLLLPGGVLLALAFISRVFPYPEFLANPYGFPPREFVLRAGPCLIIMAAIAFASRRITHLPRVFGAVAQESLLIYFVHLCIVYGSVWNHGLARFWAGSLGPAATVACVVGIILSMAGLAWVWNHWKRTHPRTARSMTWLTGAALLAWLL